MTKFPKFEIDGLSITACSMGDVELILDEAIKEEAEPLKLATVNLNFLRLAQEDPELREILVHSDHNFADGWPLLQMASLHGVSPPERVTGSDLTPMICAWAARHDWRLAFVGGSARTREILSDIIPSRYGGVLAGHWVPDYRGRSVRDPELAQSIKERDSHIVLVALGCPRQEQWVWHNLLETGARAAMGIGGSLDFMAGVQRRAPGAFQALRLEWLYRALSQPRRLGVRYVRDFLYYQRLFRHELRRTRR